jgi:YesN/AraC family two-component response regulator
MEPVGSILVVDDDPAVGEAIVAVLGARYRVRCALTGLEAINAICEAVFDLVLLDHQLPDLPGTEILKLVKRFFPSTSVVLITGQGSEDVAAAALRGGARDYLRKPFTLHDLVARVDSLFAVRRNGRERRHDTYTPLIERSSDSGLPDPDTDRSRSILRAVQHIDTHLETPLSLETVAGIAGMSKFHFCRRFKCVTGTTFRAYVIQKRVARAKDLLGDERRSVTAVAREVGFHDLTHFSRAFRRQEGVLPSVYRRGKKSDGDH